jgi:hypothetical protein
MDGEGSQLLSSAGSEGITWKGALVEGLFGLMLCSHGLEDIIKRGVGCHDAVQTQGCGGGHLECSPGDGWR